MEELMVDAVVAGPALSPGVGPAPDGTQSDATVAATRADAGVQAAWVRAVQRRTIAVLVSTQIIGGVGVAVGFSVGALLASRMGGTGFSGLGQSALVVGAALLAVPVSRLTRARGRRPGLVLAYLLAVVGAVVVVVAAARGWLALLLVGLFLFGGGSTGNYQARYAAVDLAAPGRRGRQLSF